MQPTSRKVLAAAVVRMNERVPEICEHVVRLIIAQEPTYQPKGMVPKSLLVRSVNVNVRRILLGLSDIEVSDEQELATAHTTGRQRAQQGVPLEAVLRAYRLADRIVLHAMLEEVHAETLGDTATFFDVITGLLTVIDRHSEAVVAGYREVEAEMTRRDDQRQQAMFDALLEGRGSDPTVARQAVSALGLPPEGPFAVTVSVFDVDSNRTLSPIRDTCAAYLYRAAWRIRAGREIGIIALGKSSVRRLVAALSVEAPGRIGVSDSFTSIDGVPHAFRMAEVALQTVPEDRGEVAWISQRLPQALVVSSPSLAGKLARQALGPVLDLPPAESEVLLRTLSVWYEEGRSASRAGSRLYCHRNTIMNRLYRVETLSGRSFDDHQYLLACYLGLLTLRLLPTTSGPSPDPKAVATPPAAPSRGTTRAT
ncbi:helix-turn-helix domain-containing protein [Streptomycetaceae bacterium NBC_01309]